LAEHKSGVKSNWMQNNNISPKDLVYVEFVGTDYFITLRREKQIKQMSLKKKLEMIDIYNRNI